MAKKIGTDYAQDMLHRGIRELGAATVVPGSNIAQPMYPPSGGRDAEQARGSIFDGRVGEPQQQPNVEPDKDKGMDRE